MEVGKGKPRKRSLDTTQWKEKITKEKRNKGEAYISRHTNKLIPARKIGPPCKCGCFEVVGFDAIKIIFDEFWKIGNYDLQNMHLSKLLRYESVKRSNIKDRPSRNARRIKYSIIYKYQTFDICRTAFYNIFGISEKRGRVVLDKQSITGVIETDLRGHKEPANKIKGDNMLFVQQHISSLPTVPSSQYSKAKRSYRKYLPGTLNVRLLYDMYKSWLEEKHPTFKPVSEKIYRNIFNTDFNIGFNPTKMDPCNKCCKTEEEVKEFAHVNLAQFIKVELDTSVDDNEQKLFSQ